MERIHCTDRGNRQRFQCFYEDKAKFIKEHKSWVYWDDGWKYEDGYKLADPVVRNIYSEAYACDDVQARTQLGDWAKISERKNLQTNMLRLAQSFMKISINQFDINPTVINCPNGMLDLGTKELSPHSPDQLHLKTTSAKYDPSAKCFRWLQFLAEVFEGDKELIDYMQIALGYSIMGLTTEHCMFFCHGSGRNGKGVLLDTVAYVLGDYGRTIDFRVLLHRDKANDVRVLETIGKLKGSRFVTASEIGKEARLDEPLIKKLTGGDPLTGSELHKNSYEFKPTHTLWVACNNLPIIKNGGKAMWSRIRTIPFNADFEKTAEKRLKERLEQEADGIFSWLVEGAYKYLDNGCELLPEPKACLDRTQEYRDSQDRLSVFIRECLIKEGSSKIEDDLVVRTYENWCKSNGELSEARFLKSSLENNGVRTRRKKIGWTVLGYRLKGSETIDEKSNFFTHF